MQFKNWFNESVDVSRYSIAINYRTEPEEVLDSYAKISLGYVSAGIKQYGYHTKHVYSEEPFRLLVSSRNWDDGEWVGIVSWDHKNKCFVMSKGYFNKINKSVSVISTKKCAGKKAGDVVKELHSMMQDLKEEPDRHREKLNPVKLKRGPKN